MILHALNAYYNRLKEDNDVDIPLLGFSRQKIHFALVIDKAGNLLQPLDIRIVDKKKKFPKQLIVPAAVKKAAGIASNFLWDNIGYVLGNDTKGKPQRSLETFEAFKAHQHLIGDTIDDEGMKAVLLFLDSWQPENAPTLPYWEEMAEQNVVFQLDGELRFIHERPKIQQAWLRYIGEKSSEFVWKCLVSGIESPIARLHPAIKGVKNAQSSGASVISFNRQSFESYAKTQNYNAPVSETITFTYTTALNHLLNSNRQKIQIGDASTIFWTETKSKIEQFGSRIFGFEVEKDDEGDNKESDDRAVLKDVRDFLEAARDVKELPNIDERDVKFFILGLSPNVARVSVRFWHQSTVGDFQQKIGQHFRDLNIVRQFDNDPEFPSIWRLLRETAVLKKTDNISPLLSGALTRSIMTGASYPKSLLSAVINRIRADHSINYLRAAMIKACLNRNFEMGVKMGLDTERTDIGYRLGRLFAALERVQERANPDIKATIRDRCYGSASSCPRTMFSQLLRLKNHHVSKLEHKGEVVNFEKLISEIMSEINEFPGHLILEQQGLFSIGYYHQRAVFYKKSESKEV